MIYHIVTRTKTTGHTVVTHPENERDVDESTRIIISMQSKIDVLVEVCDCNDPDIRQDANTQRILARASARAELRKQAE